MKRISGGKGSSRAFSIGRPSRLGYFEAQILLLVAKKPVHGYGIMSEVRRRTGQRLHDGSLYPALSRLEKKGFIVGRWERGKTVDRRVYSITEKGKRTLAELRLFYKNLYKSTA